MRRTAALVALSLALALPRPSRSDGGPPPAPDTSGMEAAVVRAIDDTRSAVVADPGSAQAWGALGATLHAHGLLDEAADCYDRALTLAPDDGRWADLAAVVADDLGRPAEAIRAAFDRAIALRPDDAALRLRYGLALSRRGLAEAARVALTEAVRLGPERAMAHRALGQVLLGLGHPAAAAVHLERAVDLAPRDGAAWSALARARLAIDEPDGAETAASRAARLDPAVGFDDPLVQAEVDARGVSASRLFARARARLADGDAAGASALLAELRRRRPDDADVSYLLGVAARAAGRPAEAVEHLQRALRLAPEHARALIALAELRRFGGDDRGAVELYARAVEAAPGDPAPLAAEATLLERLGESDRLVEVYRRLIALEPEQAAARVNLAGVLARSGDLAAAAAELERAVEADPRSAEAWYLLGVVRQARGAADEAHEAWRRALELDPASPAGRRLPAGPDPDLTPREEFDAIARRLTGGDNRYLGRAPLQRLLRRAAADEVEPRTRALLRADLAMRLVEAGDVSGAEKEIDAVLAGRSVWSPDDDDLARLHEVRAVVAMRRAEVSNCVRRHNADCCIFPLRGGGVHTDPEAARRARAEFTALLALRPDDLRARWLLNLMGMATGDWPGGIDERWRIPPSAFESGQDIGRFRDVAPELGVATLNLCGGVVADDFDGDGRLDVLTSTSDPDGPLTLYLNDAHGGFRDASAEWSAAEQRGGLNVVGGDYDGDGDIDALVLRGAWLFDDGKIRNSLLRNDGDRLTDVTREAGLAFPAYPTQAAAWADFDNDGDLDLYVGTESRLDRPGDRADFPGQLFRNDGDGRFTDVAREAGVTNDRYCKGVAVGDYDDDGDVDLYVSNVGANRLYRNDGGLRFTDVTREAGVAEPSGRSFATWFFDWNNDGRLDLFVAAYDAEVGDLAAEALGRPTRAGRPRLYRNDGGGRFTDVARQVGLDHAWLPMGANFGDLDNDGWLDIYLATGDPDYQTLMPNVMLRNDGGRRFVDVTESGGFGHLQKGHGVAFADFDADGDEDIYHQIGGFYPGDRFHNALFANPGHGHPSLAIELVGTRSPRSGAGARIRVAIDEPDTGRREIHRAVGSVSSFGGSPRRQSIGLGRAERAAVLEIRWPVSGQVQTFEDVEPGLVRVTEGSDALERIPLEPVPFRAGER